MSTKKVKKTTSASKKNWIVTYIDHEYAGGERRVCSCCGITTKKQAIVHAKSYAQDGNYSNIEANEISAGIKVEVRTQTLVNGKEVK